MTRGKIHLCDIRRINGKNTFNGGSGCLKSFSNSSDIVIHQRPSFLFQFFQFFRNYLSLLFGSWLACLLLGVVVLQIHATNSRYIYLYHFGRFTLDFGQFFEFLFDAKKWNSRRAAGSSRLTAAQQEHAASSSSATMMWAAPAAAERDRAHTEPTTLRGKSTTGKQFKN